MRLSLNTYSLAYAAGFFRANGHPIKYPRPECFLTLVQQSGLKSLEIPLDKYFGSLNTSLADDFFIKAEGVGINIFPCIENFNLQFLIENMPKFKEYGMKMIRIKMPHLGPTFYGGNRYSSDHFPKSLESFKLQLNHLDPVLEQFGCSVAIENHQDLDLPELVSLCESSEPSCRYITWDVGNSLSTMRMPHEFVEKAARWIANIHMKDYRVFECERGFALSRCELGKGIIPASEVISSTKHMPRLENISMELAAHPDRICDYKDPNYPKAFSHDGDEIHQFSEYLSTIISCNERRACTASGDDLIALEIEQSLSSCQTLRDLFYA
jgi:sugar phosphate isomerase/epimerase